MPCASRPPIKPGEHVAGARGRERRRQIDADRRAPARLGDDRIGPFGDDDGAEKRRRRARALQFGRKRSRISSIRFEQSREFAVMRRDRRCDPRARGQLRRSASASPAKARQSVGVEDERREAAARLVAPSAVATSARVSAPTPAPGPMTMALRRESARSSAKPAAPVEWRDHHRGGVRGIDRDGVERAGQRDEAGAGPSAARAASRAAPVMARPPDRTSAEPREYLCEVDAQTRKGGAPDRRRIGENAGPIAASAAAPMPISARTRRPQSARPGSSRWPGLRRKKVTLALASHRDAAHRARLAVDARWQVDARASGRPRACESVDPLDASARFARRDREPAPRQTARR